MQFDCSICCSENLPIKIRNKNQRIECPNCHGQFCVQCQQTYAKGDCMNCHMEFKQAFIVEHLGKSFIDKVLKPKILRELLTEQKASLDSVQPLVDWEREVRKQKKNARFGIPITLPERPKASRVIQQDTVFPCPYQECRGFITKGLCGICNRQACIRCREPYENSDHKCNPDTLMSLSALQKDTKSCPKCCAQIHRTEGCNHMFCTHCQSHWDWVTGKILKTSTNGHYLHLQAFSRNVAIRETTDDTCVENNEYSLMRDAIDFDRAKEIIQDPKVIQCLWLDSNMIRLMKRKRYNEQDIQILYQETLEEYQVKYLLGELDETAWSRNLYIQYQKMRLSTLYANVLDIYLATVDRIQRNIVENKQDIDIYQNQYEKLVELCNDSFKSIQEEFGGSLHKIRNLRDDTDVPPFI